MNPIKKIIKSSLLLHDFSPHKKLGIDYRTLSDAQFEILKSSLIENYFSKFPPPFPSHDKAEVEKGFIWMEDHLRTRLDHFRTVYVPFLNSIKALKGATVADVGCGTGASLIALAETGANVIGIDIDEGSLEVAKKRCELYGMNVEIVKATATDLLKIKPEAKFDFILFNASLEHMFLDERLESLKAAWDRLSVGDYMGIIECPNRLWFFDWHTSELPFYEWLPNELAWKYSQHSPRKYINELYKLPWNEEHNQQLQRIGRGMSFHEIDLALGDATKINVCESLGDYIYKNSNWLEKSRLKKSKDMWYSDFIQKKSGRDLHIGYFEPWLNIVFKK